MSWDHKKVLVVGLARSGIAAVKALHQLGAVVTVNDIKKESELAAELEGIAEHIILGYHPENLSEYDCVVISPGIPLDIPFVENIEKSGIKLIGELELAYLLSKGTYVGITGTNGKTTTTALTGEMFRLDQKEHFVVGNIGIAAVSKALESTDETYFVTEVSSFQLETIEKFKAHVAAILNITPDHLNRHKTMENYKYSKARIFENQTEDDYLILNADDSQLEAFSKSSKGKVFYFSRENPQWNGAYIESGMFVVSIEGTKEILCPVDVMFIFGKHNEENALAAILISVLCGISREAIVGALKSFKGVEHRIEHVLERNGVVYYNDSKATNPDSTVCALRSMNRPTLLIAGGLDKESTFDSVFEAFNGKVKALILLGETQYKLSETAKRFGYERVYLVENMEEAVALANTLAEAGDAILLSPACASWDMYVNYEKRGEHFKQCVTSLR